MQGNTKDDLVTTLQPGNSSSGQQGSDGKQFSDLHSFEHVRVGAWKGCKYDEYICCFFNYFVVAQINGTIALIM